MPGVFLLAPGPVWLDPQTQTAHSANTVTANGSIVYAGYGVQEISLIVNVTASPSGTSPTLQYTLQEVDPGDQVTTFGPTYTGDIITGVTVQSITMPSTKGGAVKVSWVVGGSSPSFSGVYATLTSKSTRNKATSATTTYSVASSVSNQTLLSSNPSRLGATVFNDSSHNLFIKLGSTSSLTSFTVRLSGKSYYEMPYGYTGQIDGIWDATPGSARITELT